MLFFELILNYYFDSFNYYCCNMTQNLMDGEYCCQKYKRFVLNIFCAENIFMDNKYIFVPYEGRFDLNIF